MLKIVTRTDEEGTTFALEGRLTGAWVQELENQWRNSASSNQPVRVMVCEVTFIDDEGRALLAEMHRDGAELVAEGCMNKAIVEQITQGERR
jgi:ABC-type transporter Mla MlaB component